MKFNNYFKLLLTFTAMTLITNSSCSTKNNIKFQRRSLPAKANIAVIIDSPNNIKNVVLVKFLQKGYNVKAINASDMYNMSDIFDIKDLKKLSFNQGSENSLVSMEKTYNNIYKMHIYNFEINKAEFLSEMKSKWKVDYLIILDLKNWEEISWSRVINLSTYSIDFIENYPTAYNDDLESIVEHFIKNMTGK